MMETRVNRLQEMCRGYLSKLKQIASKHGLANWVERIIHENEQKRCVATEEEVELLARCVDDERVNRTDIPDILGVSYRYCFDNDIFDEIKKLHHTGIYYYLGSEISQTYVDMANKRIKDGTRQLTLF